MQTVSELKEQFFLNGQPLWKIYRGTRKNNSELISSNIDEYRMTESWEKLNKVIQLNKSTIYNYTIYQMDNVKNTTGGYTLFLDLKEAPAPTATPAASSSIGNLELMNISQQFNETIQELKDQIKEQQHKQEKQELINEFNLKIQEIEAKTDTKKQGLEMLKLFAINLMKPKAAAAIGAATLEHANEESEESEEGETINYNIDFNSIFESVAIIKNHIPDVEALLFKLSETLENASDTERQNLINILKMYLNV